MKFYKRIKNLPVSNSLDDESNQSDLMRAFAEKYRLIQRQTGATFQGSKSYLFELSKSGKHQANKSFLSFSNGIIDGYHHLNIRTKITSLITQLDCDLIVRGLDELKNLRPKTAFAVSVAQQIISALNKYVKNQNQRREAQLNLNKEIANALQGVDIKDVINILEPFAYLLPYGSTLIFILRLFLK